MPATLKKKSIDTLIAELGQLSSEPARRKFLAEHKALIRQKTVEQLARLVVQKVRVSTQEAFHLAEAAVLIAKRLGGKEALALGLRAKANALYSSGDNRAAIEHHQESFRLYESLDNWNEAARTLSSSIQPMILAGEYDLAFQAAERAREIFTRLNDPWRLARLEINVGNIYHRQDRFEESIAHYERAYTQLMPYKDTEGIAVVLSNMAVCLISLNDFPRALATYQGARRFCQQNKMPLLVAQADYNIAYLYYLRGEYSHAIEALYAARRACEATGDAYHFALCHLDLSDIYLELNLSEEAREIANEGFLRFEKLGMGYEAAKTLANEATAYGQQGKTVQALERFAKAREIFEREKNLVWPWLIDLYQALLLFHEGRYFEARRLSTAAAAFFDRSALAGKAVLAHLLLARIALQVGDSAGAQKETDESLARLNRLQAPVLAFQAHLLAGQIAQARDERAAAHQAYLEARKALEALRSRLQGEELKISFVKNRMQVYEALVDLYISGDGTDTSPEEAFACMEAAKCRSMIELIFQSGQSLPLGETGQSDLVRRIRDLREELNWYYHRIELEQLRPEDTSHQRLETLQEKAQSHEKELLRTLRELPAHERENATLEAPADFSLAKLQANLPAGATLVEYFVAGDRLVAAVITREKIQILPVTVLSRAAHFLQLLRFQLSKFRMGSEYIRRFEEPLLRATQSHLESLYDELIAPLRPFFQGKHLIFVPHGPLHFLPFHALRNGDDYLCDAFTISYAPSATVFSWCQEKPTSKNTNSLVFGIPDVRAPQILQEAQSVAALLPRSTLHVGDHATSSLLREMGPRSGLLHLATHGIYRQDNPMFSGIRLGDGYLNLYDLYQMRLDARLVALSGCATGMNFVAAGDELLGLQRGLCHEGASPSGSRGVLEAQKGIWGEEMKHFTTELWIDFVNQAVDSNSYELMAQHLKQGCKRCKETVSLWQKVRQSAASEANYQPPEDVLRVAKATLAGAGLAGQRKGTGSRIKVLFDSFLQPVVEGARSAATATRQMLYRADPFQIDVQVEAKPEGNRIVVTGQLLNLSSPAIIGEGARIVLSNMRGHVVHAVTNQFGEFSAEIENSGDLQMTFASPGMQPIVISLRDALGTLGGDER